MPGTLDGNLTNVNIEISTDSKVCTLLLGGKNPKFLFGKPQSTTWSRKVIPEVKICTE